MKTPTIQDISNRSVVLTINDVAIISHSDEDRARMLYDFIDKTIGPFTIINECGEMYVSFDGDTWTRLHASGQMPLQASRKALAA